MFTFKDYLTEAIRFSKGRDNDFFDNQFAIVTFNKGDINKYKVEGRTAGLWSHACKHLDEIDKQFVDNIVQQVKRTLIDYIEQDNHPKAYEFNYFNNDKKKVNGDPLTLVKQASRASIINFLDLVNDKYQLKDPRAPIEKKMIKYLEALGDKYGSYIEKAIESSTNIDRIEGDEQKTKAFSEKNVIDFVIVGLKGHEAEMRVYLDIKHDLIVIKTGPNVNTMYKVNYNGSGRKDLLKAFDRKVMKNARFFYQSTYRAFRDFLDA